MVNKDTPVLIRFPITAVIKVLCAAGGIALAGIAAAGVQSDASMAGDVPSMSIKIDPANLATEQGVREVYRRLQRAAERVCPEASTGTRLVSSATLDCRRQAVARAVATINNPRLAALEADRAKHG